MLIAIQMVIPRLGRFLLSWTSDHVCCGLAENLSTTCSCFETLVQTEIKLRLINNLVEKISSQLTVEASLLLECFNQLYVENQEQIVQLNDLKSFEFGQKGSASKLGICKTEVEESWLLKRVAIIETSFCKQGEKKGLKGRERKKIKIYYIKVQIIYD